MNQERRGEPRIDTGQLRLVAHDSLADKLFGSVINLSQNGLMLLANRSVETGGTLQLDIRRANAPGEPILELAVNISWTRPAGTPGNVWMGAHIIGISEAHAQTLGDLIREAEKS